MNAQKTALVTGASSGIGLAVAKRLLSDGYRVYGIGRNFDDAGTPKDLIMLCFNLTDTEKLPAFLSENIKEKLSLLVNCAGVAYYGPHETVKPAAIHEMVSVNVEVPLLLSSLYLRDLRESNGSIVNISSVTAKLNNNSFGCAYGATKAAVSHFSEALFEEIRKQGVRIITIHPDLTDTDLYRNADFRPGTAEDTVLSPDEVAEAVIWAVHQREGLVVRDITLRPQRLQINRDSKK